MRLRTLLFASALSLLVPAAASAQGFTYSGFTVDPNNVSVTITGPVNRTVLAGQITLDGAGPNAGQDLAVYCLDLFDTLQNTFAYNESTLTPGVQLPGFTSPVTQTQITEIGDLMLSNGVNGDKAAAQLAIWAILYGSSFSFLSPNAAISADEMADVADVQVGGTLFNPNVQVLALHDAITAPNQTVGFAVPGPVVGAGLPGVVTGLLTLWGLRRRRKAA